MERERAARFVEALHRAQERLYAGGAVDPVRSLLCPDIVWHVPGRTAISGDHQGIDAVIAYMLRRRDLADRTVRMRRRELLVGEGQHFAALTDGSAVIAGRARRWSTIGLYRLRGERLAECRLIPFDQAQFDAIWGAGREGVAMGSDAEVVLGVIQAVEERDGEKLLELYHEDVQLHDAPSLPYGGVVDGIPSLKEQLERAPENTWLGTWGPVQPTEAERRFDPRVISEKDGEVVVLYRMRAVAPDGERFESPVLGLYEVRDGKLARAQMFHYDTAAISAFLERARAADASTAA